MASEVTFPWNTILTGSLMQRLLVFHSMRAMERDFGPDGTHVNLLPPIYLLFRPLQRECLHENACRRRP
jgi:hypothetical protein